MTAACRLSTFEENAVRHLSVLSAAVLSTLAATGASAHPGHGEPVTGIVGLVAHWVSDRTHLAIVLAAAGLGAVLAVALHWRERVRVRNRHR
ncbi:hypothetical protein CVT23_17835 [Minwuia thermotolerans]|uniref:Uncharacterized protein n=1 Tax=Minwuia thermotolerans TaxID=2056226 RepID=A0A2M9FXQ7_9PROT|nr:hypothetical protein CVT23_17835 [Minwuia thermotolerans]